MKTEIVTAVWGQPYVVPFMELVLPSLMATGNLPSWPWLDALSLHIWTTPEDAALMQTYPIWPRLQALIQCQFHRLAEQVPGQTKYLRMNLAHQQAFAQAQKSGAAAMMLMPDTVFCNGTLRALAELLLTAPHDVVFCHSPRVNSQTAIPYLHTCCQDQVLSLSPQQTVGVLLEHLHPITDSQFWDSHYFDPDSNHVYYWHPTGQLAVQAFHLHPLIYTQFYQPFDPTSSTFDGFFLQQYHQHAERVGVVQNSRILLLSLTAPQDSEPILHAPQPLARRQLCLDRFRRQGLHPIHHWLFEHLILLTPPPSLVCEAIPEITDAIQALQLFWQVESQMQTQEQTGLKALLTDPKWLRHLPPVLQQAVREYAFKSGISPRLH